MTETHTRELRSALGQVRRRWMATAWLAAIARASVAVGVIVALVAGADLLWLPSDGLLAIMAGVAAVPPAAVLCWACWSVRRWPSRRQVARYLEERAPELEDRVASAAALDERPAHTGVPALLVADAARSLRQVDLDQVVSRRRVQRAFWVAAGAAVLLVAALAVSVDPTSRAIGAARLYLFPHTVHLTVEPGDARIVAGEPLRVHARLDERGAGPGRSLPVLHFGAADEWESAEMRRADDGFVFDFPAVTTSFRYWVSAARARSDEYRVRALSAPRVARIDVDYIYPAFTGLAPRTETDGGDIYAPAGTEVTVRVESDQAVETGALVLASGDRLPLVPRDADTLEARFEVRADDSYQVTLADADGLSNAAPLEYFIRAIDDRPPVVRVLRPAADRRVTALEEVTVEARADDDYGLDGFELVFAVRGGTEQAIVLDTPAQATSVAAAQTLYVEDMAVTPGDFVTYYVRARDVNRGKQATETRSDIFFLEVIPFEEEFVEAPSQASSGRADSGLGDLAEAQKQVIIATWKLDRRSLAGASEEDVRTVARAQAEIKARAQQAALMLGGRRRVGADPAGAQTSNPLGLAVVAMEAAQTALERADTAQALPNEMEALNQLLKADAEMTRRMVSQQQASAGGSGSGRASQDLSALFDRELRRQQETNYETRQDSQQAASEAESELDKVRELARRQDELTRRQRELEQRQASLSPSELRRQLERLTREQSELRRQAEELARELSRTAATAPAPERSASAQSGAESGRPPATSQGGQGAENGGEARADPTGEQRMRAVSEQMRSATSSLRREDLARAGDDGERALEELRALERGLRGRVPGERRRALGELQLEGQQLAEAQRRLARATAALEPEDGPEERRQAAARQAELATRMESLEQRLGEMAGVADGRERAALDEALAAIEAQELSARMRDSAEALRQLDATGGGRQALEGGLEQVARDELALADEAGRMAATLGEIDGAEDPELRRLSDELARARILAGRLGELERQLEVQAARERATDGAPAGQPGAAEAAGAADEAAELARLREDYERELGAAADLLDGLRRENPELDRSLRAQEGYRSTRSAPGTEAFKQDFAAWEQLRRDVTLALERYESNRAARLAERTLRDRLNGGTDERSPEQYRALIEAYYRSLAGVAPPP